MADVFSIIGGIAGFFIGLPLGNPFLGFSIGYSIGTAVDYALLPTPQVEGPRIDELRMQNSNYGKPIPRIYGSARVAGNIIWLDEIKHIARTVYDADFKSDVTTHSYYATVAIGICNGPIGGILRIWADNKLIYDMTAGGSEVVTMWPGQNRHQIYLGTEDQEPNGWIVTAEGEDSTPAYRGMAYIVFYDFRLDEWGGHIPNFNFEVASDIDIATDYVDLGGVASVWGSDTLVKDGSYLYKNSAQHWDKINLLDNSLVASIVHDGTATNFVPAIPLNGFDIDNRGNIITTGKINVGDPDEHFVQLSSRDLHYEGVTLESGRWSTGTHPFTTEVYYMRFDSPGDTLHNGFIFGISTNKRSVFSVLHETFGNWSDYNDGHDTYTMADGATALYAEMISTDSSRNEEAAYVLCNDVSGNTYIVVLDPNSWEVEWQDMFSDNAIDISAYITNASFITVDQANDQLIVGSIGDSLGINQISFFDMSDLRDSQTVTHLGDLTSSNPLVDPNGWSSWHLGVVGGYLWLHTLTTIIKIDVGSHTIAAEYTIPGPVGSLQGAGIYDATSNSYFVTNTGAFRFAKILLERATANSVKLSTIVDDLCNAVGLDDAEIDVSELTDDVRGYIVDNRMSARAAIQTLRSGFWFDGVESDGKIKFPKRGGASIATITDEDLGAYQANSERAQKLITVRQQEAELPRVVEIVYIDQDANYATGTQRAFRQVVQTEQVAALTVPIVFSPDEAHACALKHLYNLWMQRTRHNLVLPREYMYLDTGDVLTINEDSNEHIVRVEQIAFEGGKVTLAVVNEDASLYTQTGSGIALPTPDNDINWQGPTYITLLDLPLLSFYHNEPGIYIATQGYRDNWDGATVFAGPTLTGPFEPWLGTSRDAIIGIAEDVLPDVNDPWLWDYAGEVTIRLFDASDTLTTVTAAEVLDNANMAVLGDEVFNFTTATDNSDGTVTLSGLLRGRKGTEWATGTHIYGDLFVLMDSDLYHFRTVNPDFLNQTRYYFAVSNGLAYDASNPLPVVWTGRNMKPLSPQHVTGARDVSDNLTIAWIRRGRYGGEWTDLVGTPLGEVTEAYQVDVLDTDSAQTVLRTIAVTSETASYTAAEQTADGLTPGDDVTIVIYQMSDDVGRGFGTTAIV
jgi:hypothetical protein